MTKTGKSRWINAPGGSVCVSEKLMQKHGINEIRIGVCNWCRAVAGEVNAQNNKVYVCTNSHHEYYDKSDPLNYTIELCPVCHGVCRRKSYKQEMMIFASTMLKALGSLNEGK